MKLKEFDVLLDIKKQKKSVLFEVVQGDNNSNVLNISLVEDLNPYNLTNTTVDIIFRKADGTTVQQTDNAVVNEAQGRIVCVLKTNTIACPGKVIAEVRVMESDVLLTSTRFEFSVRASLISGETIESTNEFPILSQLMVTAEDLIERTEQIEERVPENVITRIEGVEHGKINKTDIVNTDTINDATKVPSSAVTYALGQEIDALNDNLADYLINLTTGNSPYVSGVDANDLNAGMYIGSGFLNVPTGVSWCVIWCIRGATAGAQMLIVITSTGNAQNNKIYIRTLAGSVWREWVEK